MARLMFDDEFNSLGPPWQPAYPWAPDGFTTPDQGSWLVNPSLVAADGNPFSVTNGALTVSDFDRPADVSPDLVGQEPRIGGQILTEGTFVQQYGYFEIRMQMPSGGGFDGGFWLMPESGAWPPELDIAEINSDLPNLVLNTLVHADGTIQQAYADVANAAAEYHTYGFSWTPAALTWYVDGKETYSLPTPPEMNQPMYMIAGLTSGAPNSWAGVAAPGTVGQMKIDYIRVYDTNPYTGAANNVAAGVTSSDVFVPIGTDVLLAGAGQTFIFDTNPHTTEIDKFQPAADRLEFWTVTPSDLKSINISAAAGGYALVSIASTKISLPGVLPSQLTQEDLMLHSQS